MFKLLMAICVTLPLAVTSAQTASELADRYAHHEVYEPLVPCFPVEKSADPEQRSSSGPLYSISNETN
jgi:hypothetical protein